MDRALLDLLPVRSPQELVLLTSPGPKQGHVWSDSDSATSFSYPMYRDLRDRGTVFQGLLAEYPFDASVATERETDRARGELVTGNYFNVLGVVPELGRTLNPDDDRAPGAQPVAVLSHGYWTRRFGGNVAVLNKAITVNGHSLTVVGVARAAFAGIQPGRPVDVFVPLMMKAEMTPGWNGLDDPKDYWLQMVGRVKPGLSRERAQVALQPLYASLLLDLSKRMTGMKDTTRRQFLAKKLLLLPGGHGRLVLRQSLGQPLVSLMGMVALVLLIACSNLAGLLAARGDLAAAGVRDPPGDRREPDAAASPVHPGVPALRRSGRGPGNRSRRRDAATPSSARSRPMPTCGSWPRESTPGCSRSLPSSRS